MKINIIISDSLIFNKPNNLNLLESSTIPISYGTAYLALIKYANIKENDIVLIHSASGGLGLAAIEICNTIGCKIIVSAGNEEKREYLKNKKNVVLVTDSRNRITYKNDISRLNEDIREYLKNPGYQNDTLRTRHLLLYL